jgi:hypothetical protein
MPQKHTHFWTNDNFNFLNYVDIFDKTLCFANSPTEGNL